MAFAGHDLNDFMDGVKKRSPGETEFHQAVQEVAATILPYIADKPEYTKNMILERMTEPDRIISFRVTWQDDEGNVRVNRGHRVQFNNSIGPYKGGIRFHPSVTLSVLKFLGFEQTFKNSLTQLPMGGGKGGARLAVPAAKRAHGPERPGAGERAGLAAPRHDGHHGRLRAEPRRRRRRAHAAAVRAARRGRRGRCRRRRGVGRRVGGAPPVLLAQVGFPD